MLERVFVPFTRRTLGLLGFAANTNSR